MVTSFTTLTPDVQDAMTAWSGYQMRCYTKFSRALRITWRIWRHHIAVFLVIQSFLTFELFLCSAFCVIFLSCFSPVPAIFFCFSVYLSIFSVCSFGPTLFTSANGQKAEIWTSKSKFFFNAKELWQILASINCGAANTISDHDLIESNPNKLCILSAQTIRHFGTLYLILH